MTTQDFKTTILVDQSPMEVYNAINNVRGWWSEEIEGDSEKVNDIFIHRFRDVHRCKIKVDEQIPGKKVEWLVLENHFSFTQDATEWTGTRIVFEIQEKSNQTQLTLTHVGLVPAYECFELCSEAWTNYIGRSLRNFIATGKGEPNAREGGYNGEVLDKFLDGKAQNEIGHDYTTSIVVEASPKEVFDAIGNIKGWWTENVEGKSREINDEFEVRFEDIHYSRQRLVEVVPNSKIVWLVTDSKLTFVENMTEWTNTRISFQIASNGDKTELTFTHHGLTPKFECYDGCSDAWSDYITGSLFGLITVGKGTPDPKATSTKARQNSIA